MLIKLGSNENDICFDANVINSIYFARYRGFLKLIPKTLSGFSVRKNLFRNPYSRTQHQERDGESYWPEIIRFRLEALY